MKKRISVILVLTMVLCLAGCGGNAASAGDAEAETAGEEAGEETADAGQGIYCAAQVGKKPVDPDPVKGEEKRIVILPAVAGKAAGFLGGAVQDFSEADQQLLAFFLPVQFLEEFKVLDINGDETPAVFRGAAEALLHNRKEGGFGHLVRHPAEQVLGRKRRA